MTEDSELQEWRKLERQWLHLGRKWHQLASSYTVYVLCYNIAVALMFIAVVVGMIFFDVVVVTIAGAFLIVVFIIGLVAANHRDDCLRHERNCIAEHKIASKMVHALYWQRKQET